MTDLFLTTKAMPDHVKAYSIATGREVSQGKSTSELEAVRSAFAKVWWYETPTGVYDPDGSGRGVEPVPDPDSAQYRADMEDGLLKRRLAIHFHMQPMTHGLIRCVLGEYKGEGPTVNAALIAAVLEMEEQA